MLLLSLWTLPLWNVLSGNQRTKSHLLKPPLPKNKSQVSNVQGLGRQVVKPFGDGGPAIGSGKQPMYQISTLAWPSGNTAQRDVKFLPPGCRAQWQANKPKGGGTNNDTRHPSSQTHRNRKSNGVHQRLECDKRGQEKKGIRVETAHSIRDFDTCVQLKTVNFTAYFIWL